MYKILLVGNAALLLSVPAMLLVRNFVPTGMIGMIVCSISLGSIIFFTARSRMKFADKEFVFAFKWLLICNIAVLAVLWLIIVAMACLRVIDLCLHPFLLVLPLFVPSVVYLFARSINEIPAVQYSHLIFNQISEPVANEENSYQMIVRLVLEYGARKRLVINTKGSDNINFASWIKRVVVDYNAKYPFRSIDSNVINGYSWRFYILKYGLFRKNIDVTCTFKENMLKNNCRIYGKQIG